MNSITLDLIAFSVFPFPCGPSFPWLEFFDLGAELVSIHREPALSGFAGRNCLDRRTTKG